MKNYQPVFRERESFSSLSGNIFNDSQHQGSQSNHCEYYNSEFSLGPGYGCVLHRDVLFEYHREVVPVFQDLRWNSNKTSLYTGSDC